jgi:hypothetical protein
MDLSFVELIDVFSLVAFYPDLSEPIFYHLLLGLCESQILIA